MKLKASISIFVLIVITVALFVGCSDSDSIIQSLIDISGAPLKYDDSAAVMHLNVAAVCMQCSMNKEENITRMKGFISQIVSEKPETQLIVFGETALGRYYGLKEPEAYQRSIAETIPGPAVLTFGDIADSLDIYIAFGLPELKSDTLFNSLVLLNPQGEIEGIHRKVHLVAEDIESGFTASNNKTIVYIEGIKTGMIICADVNSFALTEYLVKEEIGLLIHSLASLANDFKIDNVARQFNSWVIFANRYGQEGDQFSFGTCYISDPSGTIRVGGEGKERYLYYRTGVY